MQQEPEKAAEIKKPGYMVIRPHEVDARSFEFENKNATPDQQRFAILEYAFMCVRNEMRRFCDNADWPQPKWADGKTQADEVKSSDKNTLDKRDTSTQNDLASTPLKRAADAGGNSGE